MMMICRSETPFTRADLSKSVVRLAADLEC